MAALATSLNVDVILVGCGVPKRGMGWYHLTQLLKMPGVTVRAVVEPWFMGPGAEGPGGPEFHAMKRGLELLDSGVEFAAAVADLPPLGVDSPCVALIAGRTADNPKFFREVIEAGCSAVYLEKPGAPSVAELEGMKAFANERSVKVFLGYNKNVTKYVVDALAIEAANAGATTTFVHNNAYMPEQLPECFARNAEGMLKNMAVHELALLVTYYGVTATNIANVEVDTAYSSLQTLEFDVRGETKSFTDFPAAGFTITTTEGKTVTVRANRCGDAGGSGFGEAIVELNGAEIGRTRTPDAELQAYCDAMIAKDPEMMPYFFLQSEDYKVLKTTVIENVASGQPEYPERIATIETAVETLKVAEHLTGVLTETLSKL